MPGCNISRANELSDLFAFVGRSRQAFCYSVKSELELNYLDCYGIECHDRSLCDKNASTSVEEI